jgi:hypothetical protein
LAQGRRATTAHDGAVELEDDTRDLWVRASPEVVVIDAKAGKVSIGF